MKRNFKDRLLSKKIVLKDKDFLKLFISLGKAVVYGLGEQHDKAALSLADAGASFSIEDSESGLVWQLIDNAAVMSIFDLVMDSRNSIPWEDAESFIKKIERFKYGKEIVLDEDFFKNPKRCSFSNSIQEALTDWLTLAGVNCNQTKTIVNRFPTYFLYALHEEWRENHLKYSILLKKTPFEAQVAEENDWDRYKAYLEKQTQECVFGEAFGLSDIFVPLCAYYETIRSRVNSYEQIGHGALTNVRRRETEKNVVELNANIGQWIDAKDKEDAIRIISGGPGSGKSSFAKIFAHKASSTHDVLLLPLYKLDLGRDVKEAVGEFLVSNKFFGKNPIGIRERLLIIFDGLDEIMLQGRASLEAANNFIDQVQKLLNNHNNTHLQIRVIITGRELPVQEVEKNFRKDGQILHILPYFIRGYNPKAGVYCDPKYLIGDDKRDIWWKRYGELIGKDYNGLPKDLKYKSLDEITSQPLLNYLLALSYDRKEIEFSEKTNLNEIYEDLVNKVYEREYQSRHRTVESLDRRDFQRILEEIAASAWQGAGRTASLKDIEERCRKSNLEHILNEFQNKAKEGVTNLLTAFYFRDASIPGSDRSFEFTHKSFGEYLAARKIISHLKKTKIAMERYKEDQTGWTYEAALTEWMNLCSITPIDEYIFKFLKDEVTRHNIAEVSGWQEMLCELISFMLKNGMPFEKTGLSFINMMKRSRNSEVSLLVALSACSCYTDNISKIKWPDETSAGQWFLRLFINDINLNIFLRDRLHHLDFSGNLFRVINFYAADLSRSNLKDCNLFYANLRHACLYNTCLEGANLHGAILEKTDLRFAVLRGARLGGSCLRFANLSCADLRGAKLIYDTKANERDVPLEVRFEGAILKGVKLDKEQEELLKEIGVDI